MNANHYHLLFDAAKLAKDRLSMQTNMTTFTAAHRPMPAVASAGVHESAEQPATLVESTELLRGNKTVGILHNGSLYRLQATKLGKLILTK